MELLPFVGRRRELQLFQEEWEAGRASLLILYGRRRVGKTHLIQHWITTAGVRALYWVAEPTSAADQLRSFSQALFTLENGSPAPAEFTYVDWRIAFQQLARLANRERLAVAIDEFTYVMASQPSIAGILQNAWDHSLKRANLFLIVSGSHIGMMQRDLLAYQAPLYGRATATLKLMPLPFGLTRTYFSRYRADERVAVYAMLGGVPGYWERFEKNLSLDQNIRKHVLSGRGLLMDEPRLLLQDFLSEVHNYVGILRAIAEGKRIQKEIATGAGLNDRHISMYLRNLTATGYIERRVSITASPNTRQGRYHITDPFLRFYFRFLSRRQPQLAVGVQAQAVEELKRHLVDFIGTHTWEELCREWALLAGAHGRLPFMPDQVGSAWTHSAQIDVVGVNSMDKTLVLGECKWDRHPVDQDALEKLIAQADAIIPKDREWKVFFLGFARAGWTEAAQHFAAQIARRSLHHERWTEAGMQLIDLKQLDDDLAAWA